MKPIMGETKVTKRLFGLLVVATLALFLALPAVQAHAAPDYEDTTLALNLNQNTTWGSQIRDKGTTSSVYMRVTSMGNFAYIYVDGYKSNNTGRINCTWNGSGSLRKVGKYEIYNHIREPGFTSYVRAQVTAWRDWGQAKAIKGVWSPDYAPESGVVVLNP